MNRGLTTDTYQRVAITATRTATSMRCATSSTRIRPTTATRAPTCNTDKGCTKLGVENLKNGVVTRGILIDIPRLKGAALSRAGHAGLHRRHRSVGEEGRRQSVGPGDAIFLRTGRWARREKLGPWNVGQNEAGYHASVAPWLKARGVVVPRVATMRRT